MQIIGRPPGGMRMEYADAIVFLDTVERLRDEGRPYEADFADDD